MNSMMRQHHMQGDPFSNNWCQAVEEVKQEVVQSGGASLQALCRCLDRFPGVSGADIDALAQDLAFIGQQLHALSRQTSTAADTQAGTTQHPQQQQLQKQPPVLVDVLHACVRFCKAVADALSTVQKAHEPQRLHSRWQHSQRHRQQQQQQQHAPQQLLPAAAATALCSCLRQWSDPMLLPAPQRNLCQAECDLPQAAVVALGALLPTQLSVITAHERAAVLALLLALAQPPQHGSNNSATGAAASNSSAHTPADELGADQGRQQQQQDVQDSQHWALACKAVVALTDTISEALRSSSATAAASAGSSSKQSTGGAAAGLQPEEAANIIAGLVEALSTSCGVRGSGGSSSRSGSTGGAAGHPSSNTRTASTGGSSSGGAARPNSSSGSSRQHPGEGVLHSQYYASLLVALNHAVNSNKQGWQGHAGAITECARKLFTYGTQPQQQQQVGQPASNPDVLTAAANGSPAAATQSAAPVSQQPVKKKYVPPHARAAATAVQSPNKQAQDKQQQHLQDSSDESEQSASDWSDVSDNEFFQGSSSRRGSSSSSSKERSLLKHQQQQLHDPIKAVRVRSALLQLLQVLIQADPRALHPYWAALLPSQAPLQQSPLSPHLLTMLLYDPSDKVRLLAAGVLGGLLEGPTARSLLAVAEAKTAHPSIRGFTTMSVSLGHMLLSLHAGLLALVTAWQQQQQPQSQRQQQGVLQVPAVLLSAVLRVLCALVPVTPYERLPSTLLTDVVDRTWQLWQQLQPPPVAASPLSASTRVAAAAAGNGGAGTVVPRLVLSAAAPAAGSPVTPARTSSSSSGSGSGSLIAAVAVLAQAFSTKKPLPALGRWLGGSVLSSSSSSRCPPLFSCLLAAAGAQDCLLRIEALAALRGCCINYSAAIPAQHSQTVAEQSALSAAATVSANDRPALVQSAAGAGSSSSTGGNSGAGCWQQLLAVVDVSVAAAAQPASARSTPRSSPRVSSTADSPAAPAADGSGSTSPEVKAGQHAVRLLGDWLAAATAAEAAAVGGQQQQQLDHTDLAANWASVLQLLLSDSVWHHPSPVIRSAAAAVCGMVPAEVWLVLPVQLRQQLLAAAAATAAGADVTAMRAAACKLLGSCAVMPGVLGQQQQQHGSIAQQQQQQQAQQQDVCQEQQLLQSLAQCVSDEAVSVRLSAAWALANVCDELRRQLDSTPACSTGALCSLEVQQQQQQQQGGPVMCPAVLRMLCDAAVAAAGDTEKVRAHGVRAVGALLAAWQPVWALDSSSSSSSSSIASAPGGASNGVLSAAAAATEADWSWVSVWLRAAFSALQSCLAARSMKVVWNAACAAAASLQNSGILALPVVADSTPGLLRMLVVLVRDSSNYKIKTHAAAALAAPRDRSAYGEVFADGLLVLLAALQGLQGSSNSSVQAVPVAAVDAYGAAAAAQQAVGSSGVDTVDEEGAFPNYRYIPGLQAQLESSLCHLLALLQPSDTTRLREQLKRNQQLLLTAMARCAESAAVEAGQQETSAHAGAVAAGNHASGAGNGLLAAGVSGGSQQQHGFGQAARQPQVQSALPADPFGQGAVLSPDGPVVAGGKGSAGARTAGSTATGAAGGSPSKAGALRWGAGVGAEAVPGKQGRSGPTYSADMGVEGSGGQTATSVSPTVLAALGGLASVLGPGVLDAWAQQQVHA